MKPIVFQKRVEIPGGLWSDKVGGAFQEGDPSKTTFYIEGKCDIKERAGRLRLFFQNISLTKRRVIVSNEAKEAFINTYRSERGIVIVPGEEDTDEDEEERLKRQSDEAHAFEEYVKAQQAKELEVPRLFVYMTKKTPKKRMIDIHKTGSRVFLNSDEEGQFGRERTLGNFEASLKDITDAIEYLGVMVVKMANDKPVTDEPVVYGLVKLQSSRFNRVKTLNALNLTEISETLSKVANQRQQDGGNENNQLRVAEVLKPLSVYSQVASRAWVAFQRDQGEDIDYALFLKMLDYSEVFLVDAQARRLFDAVDMRSEGKISISEFENFLMAYDVLGQASSDLALLDIYDTLKVSPNVAQFGEFGNHDGMDFIGFQESMQMIGAEAPEEEMLKTFCQAGGVKLKDVETAFLSWPKFKKAWSHLCNVDKEFEKRRIKVDRGLLGVNRNRDKLMHMIDEKETAYFDNLNAINGIIEGIKSDRRHRKEEKRHEHAQFKDRLQHEANKFIGKLSAYAIPPGNQYMNSKGANMFFYLYYFGVFFSS